MATRAVAVVKLFSMLYSQNFKLLKFRLYGKEREMSRWSLQRGEDSRKKEKSFQQQYQSFEPAVDDVMRIKRQHYIWIEWNKQDNNRWDRLEKILWISWLFCFLNIECKVNFRFVVICLGLLLPLKFDQENRTKTKASDRKKQGARQKKKLIGTKPIGTKGLQLYLNSTAVSCPKGYTKGMVGGQKVQMGYGRAISSRKGDSFRPIIAGMTEWLEMDWV